MDYSHGEEDVHINAEVPAPDWPEWSQGPRSDGAMYERVNPFNSMQAHTAQQVSTEARYGLDPYQQNAMAWPHHHASSHHHPPPSLHLSQDEDPDLDFLEHTTSYSTLGSPAFDQTSFLSVSPQMTPEATSGRPTKSYFPMGAATSGSHSPANSDDARTTTTAARKKERAQHNVVEHRYREKLNSQIAGLRDKVPALREAPHPRKGGKEPAKVGKSIVLVKAGEYIERLEDENARLRKRNESLERLVQKLVQGRASGTGSGFEAGPLSHP